MYRPVRAVNPEYRPARTNIQVNKNTEGHVWQVSGPTSRHCIQTNKESRDAASSTEARKGRKAPLGRLESKLLYRPLPLTGRWVSAQHRYKLTN